MRKPNNIQSHAQAAEKLKELLHCGNERVELSAAKEILSLAEELERESEKEQTVALTVNIRIVGESQEDPNEKNNAKDA